jgi:hypothetical protein
MAVLDRAVQIVLEGTQNAEQARNDGNAATLAWVYDAKDETRVCVYRMAFGNARLCIGPLAWATYDAGYCYDGVDMAVMAAALWIAGGCEGEPEHWKKNLQTQEYREPGER